MRVFIFSMSIGLTLPAFGQNNRDELKKKVDAVIIQAYKEAAVKFPCKLKTSGKAKMGRWKDVENCVNPAHDFVDWDGHAETLKKIREEERVSRDDLVAAVEASLTEYALLFHSIFIVNEKDVGLGLLPLSNSLLKFLPDDSLTGLTVYDKKGELLGVFTGVYSFERSGGLEILTGYYIVSFQYTDLRGNVQTPGERFLLDSYGVPWRDARLQLGFRLPSNKLIR